jgi:hypothetical protein
MSPLYPLQSLPAFSQPSKRSVATAAGKTNVPVVAAAAAEADNNGMAVVAKTGLYILLWYVHQ